MKIDRATFKRRFTDVYGELSPSQTQGYEAIFDFWDSRSVLVDKRWLAYILATAFHETGQKITALRECFCDTDECSIRCITKLYTQGKIKQNYAIPHNNGHSYFGRGLVQLTHGYNYKKAGRMIGLKDQLYNDPNLVLNLDISVKVLCVGMLTGSFVPGHNLERYFNKKQSSWLSARKIVNGGDKKEEIKEYALNFLSFIEMISNEKIINDLNQAELFGMYMEKEKYRELSVQRNSRFHDDDNLNQEDTFINIYLESDQ